MQKISSLLLALIACAGTMFADKVQIGDLYYNLNADNKTAEVTYQEEWSSTNYSYVTAVNIPESVDYNSVTYTVTSIGKKAFCECSALTAITIPNSVTSIGDFAFVYCTGLTSITIPNSVTSIGESAFQGCTGLTSITIPNSVTSIGNDAFHDCTGLTSIVVASENTNYDSRENCNALIKTSSNTLIRGCQNTIIPSSVTSIGNWAFHDCTGLTNITIPNSVTNIESHAFGNCSDLTNITIPNSVTSIGGSAFEYCTGLTNITIPNSVTSIGDNAFRGCSGLTSIVVASGNTRYDSRENCNALIKTSSNTLIAGCQNTIIPNSVTSIGNYAFERCSALTSVTIPNSVTSIGDWAFYGCYGLTSITIPNRVTSIGIRAFSDCSDLTNITIPNSVTSIGDYAFYGCTGLTSLTISNSVTSIGHDTFKGCTGLTSITIPNSVTSIGESAFQGCSGLKSVTIGNSVTSIGDYAFYGCTGLTSITCEAVVPPTLGISVFNYVNKSIPIYVPANSIEAYKAADGWKEFGDNIQPIQAEEAVVSEPKAEPTNNSVAVAWPAVPKATIYIINIWKGSKLICTIAFDNWGHLLIIVWKAPSRDGNYQTPMATQTETGWQYVIEGLEPETEYNYEVIAKENESDEEPLYSESKTFTTTGIATSITNEELGKCEKVKILRDGQLLILTGDKTYTVTGQQLK